MKKLKYSIHNCSSSAPNYGPENIMEDKPHDQSSRWSSGTNYPPQYIVLKLDAPALVETITFGKFDKTHICNLKKLKVFVGMTDACALEVLETGLKNDCVAETFNISASYGDYRVPCLYVRLAPLLGWGPSFNLSIWYVAITGEDDLAIVGPYIDRFRKYEESQLVKLCLKHFRQQGYLASFKTLTEETGIALEDDSMTELHGLVMGGEYERIEEFMAKALADGRCSEYVKKQIYRPSWVLNEVGSNRPGMRGGHQMCVDPYNGTIYLLGGWDGYQDMGDFWSFNVKASKWTLISKDTSADGGPYARSCHKMIIDLERQQLFVLGRYVDTQCRWTVSLLSDLYMYDIRSATWTLITEDTASMGGPQLLFDHQMCFDALKRTIYIYGGRVITLPFWRPGESTAGSNAVSELKLSGLYSYHVATNTWTLLCEDVSPNARPSSRQLRSRVGHSMVFHSKYRKLYIFGGQRSKDYMHDLVTYDVDTGETEIVMRHTETQPDSNAPSSGYTQRATLDPDLDEIYVLSGLSKDREKREDDGQYSLWVYSIENNKWTCIHKNDHFGESYWTKMQRVEPCPRFAHQFIYNEVTKVHYLFGGNPGRTSMPKLRLDDFWELHLSRPSQLQLLRRFQFIIRKHRFEELAIEDRLVALEYLQTSVCDIIDHNEVDQTNEFHELTSVLFKAADSARLLPRPVASLRDSLYNKLTEFFPFTMTQPVCNLADVLQFCTHEPTIA